MFSCISTPNSKAYVTSVGFGSPRWHVVALRQPTLPHVTAADFAESLRRCFANTRRITFVDNAKTNKTETSNSHVPIGVIGGGSASGAVLASALRVGRVRFADVAVPARDSIRAADRGGTGDGDAAGRRRTRWHARRTAGTLSRFQNEY